MFTQHRIHAIREARKFVEMGYRNIIVVGGDGTMNETVNGIFTQAKRPTDSVTIGMIPVGTGNDWCRMFGIPDDYRARLILLKKGIHFLQDVAWVNSCRPGWKKPLFCNMAGMGYDAMVAEKTNKQKDEGKAGPLSYFVNIFSSFSHLRKPKLKCLVDGEEVLKPLFLQ
jgi:diacylglycerol kinase family enzyme